MTPSSTRAEAGEEASTLSVPSTPVQAAVGVTSGHYDLVPPNLKLASGESSMPNPAQIALTRGLSTQSNAGSVVPPSLGSSRASQYDPSSTGDENPEKMMRDVSGISTPHSTPKADLKDLDESDLKDRLQGLHVDGSEVDRDPTPEPPSQPEIGQGDFVKAKEVDGIVSIEDMPRPPSKDKEEALEDESMGNHYKNTEGVNPQDPPTEQTIPGLGQSQAQTYGDKPHPNDLADPSAPSADDTEGTAQPSAQVPTNVDDVLGPELDEDPNKASDLDDLKAGKLEREKSSSGVHTQDQNPLNNIAEATLAQGIDEQIVPEDEIKEQGGVAGQRIEDIEEPTSIEPPKSQAEEYTKDDDMDVHTATATSQSQSQETSGDSTSTARPKQPTEMMPDVIEGKGAAGIPLDVAEQGGSGPMTSGETDKLNDLLNKKRLEEHAEEEEKEGEDNDESQQLETEEDRDEGAPRKDVLIGALDQNKDPETDLQEETDETQREKAREVTANMTEKLRGEDDQKDMDAADAEEELIEKEKQEGHGEEQEVVDLKNSRTKDLFGGTEALTSDEAGTTGDEAKPTQVQIEPAPVGQPPEEAIVEDHVPSDAQTAEQGEFLEHHGSSHVPVSPPAFPTPPDEDPDVVDPPKTATDTPAEPAGQVDASTPIDSTFLKAFPDVPDEEKPRVQVHVSQSPASSPLKSSQSQADPETPAKSRNKPESLNLPTDEAGPEEGNLSPEKEDRRESLDVDQTPVGGPAKLTKRLSTRKSPKSPLLDDEDPGDFEAGEGWAVVTK